MVALTAPGCAPDADERRYVSIKNGMDGFTPLTGTIYLEDVEGQVRCPKTTAAGGRASGRLPGPPTAAE